MSQEQKDTSRKSQKMFLGAALLIAAGALAFISFGNIGENLVYYWNPTEVVEAGDAAYGATIRLGGVVKEGSLEWKTESNDLYFKVEDDKHTVTVHATGAPPQMFREGIGVLVEGTMVKGGVFESDRLMVKHSNEYRAPEEGKDSKDLYKTVENL